MAHSVQQNNSILREHCVSTDPGKYPRVPTFSQWQEELSVSGEEKLQKGSYLQVGTMNQEVAEPGAVPNSLPVSLSGGSIVFEASTQTPTTEVLDEPIFTSKACSLKKSGHSVSALENIHRMRQHGQVTKVHSLARVSCFFLVSFSEFENFLLLFLNVSVRFALVSEHQKCLK